MALDCRGEPQVHFTAIHHHVLLLFFNILAHLQQGGSPSNICIFLLTGVPSEFVVKTCNAGSGTLSVNIDGPSKVKMDCRECPEGYKITYTPMAPGNYLITIKYGGPQHIVGSPFKAKITGVLDSIYLHDRASIER